MLKLLRFINNTCMCSFDYTSVLLLLCILCVRFVWQNLEQLAYWRLKICKCYQTLISQQQQLQIFINVRCPLARFSGSEFWLVSARNTMGILHQCWYSAISHLDLDQFFFPYNIPIVVFSICIIIVVVVVIVFLPHFLLFILNHIIQYLT